MADSAPKSQTIELLSSEALNLEFAKALLNPEIEPPSGVAKISGTEFKKAPKRFDVYRNNVIVSLMEALKTAYPSILAILDDESFEKVSRIFVANHPPKSAMMQTYGDDFSEFLSAFPPLKNAPFLSDVAKLEQAWITSFNAVDDPHLEPEEFGNFPQETIMNLVFEFQSATYLQSSEFAVVDLFNFRFEKPTDAPEISISQSLLLTRPELEQQLFLLDQPNYTFLEKLKSGGTLQIAAQAALDLDESFNLPNAIALLIQSGAVKSATPQES